MAKKRKRGILGPAAHHHRVKSSAQPQSCPPTLQPNLGCVRSQKTCKLKSELQQQCSVIVGKLLSAASTGASGGTVKGLCLRPHVTNKRAVYAVVCETLKHVSILKAILQRTDFLDLHPWKQEELLAGHDGATSLSDLLPRENTPMGKLSQPHTQRYVRCNTALISTADVIRLLHQPPKAWGAQHQQQVASKSIQCEQGMPDVLAVPAGVIVHDHPLVTSGKVVIQGRSSCMPAHALAAKPGWNVLDCCAAPGNKTTHVAAMVGSAGSVMALDKDKMRCELLQRTVTRCKASNVQVLQQDFLKVDPGAIDCLRIQGILLDPSCSGSGTAKTRMDFLLPCKQGHSDSATVSSPDDGERFPGPTSNSTQRVKSLAAFQTRALQHALKFTSVQRIVYSTCSIYVEENENVVAAVLPEAEAAGFYLVRALPFWHRRGLTSAFPWADNLVRVHPDLDGGDGFFVAVFEREREDDWPE